MKLLLHICCAPCTIYPLTVLREGGYEIGGLFYNPNIHPYREYHKRLQTLIEYANRVHLSLRLEPDYPMEEFLKNVAPEPADRCRYCYRSRLHHAVHAALEKGFDGFSTTLLYSKYQKHELIMSIAEDLAGEHGITFVYRDFREGWAEGVRISKETGMYRQSYCGCIYSEKERYFRPMTQAS